MSDDNQVEFQHIIWQRKIPETVLDVYCNYVLVLPRWKQSFPAYVHPAIRDAIELAYNQTKITTETPNMCSCSMSEPRLYSKQRIT